MNNLVRFLKRYYNIFLFLILEGVSVYLISLSEGRQSNLILTATGNISGSCYKVVNEIESYFYLKNVNKSLVKENIELRKMLETSYVKLDRRIHEDIDTAYSRKFSFIDAKVISKSINKRNNFIMIDMGSSSGIEEEMGVISPNGIVGVVVKTTEKFSLVMTVLHGDSRINVRNTRTKTTGTLIWNGRDYTEGQIIDMPSSIPIKKGDSIVSSGFSGNFPEGIMVGVVDKFDKDSGTGFYKVNVKFAVDYNKLEYVYVIKNLFKIEQDELLKYNVKDSIKSN